MKGLNALLVIASTPRSAPVIAAARLRKGSTNSTRGVAKLLTDALGTVGRCGASGTVLVRADSAYYSHDIVAAARQGRARLSITARARPPDRSNPQRSTNLDNKINGGSRLSADHARPPRALLE
ncbi:MAG: hypothetical protein LH603_13565 [Pseudonocardia sp.]|nr:hypothetical protein [Pseudonocardia sp.]